MAVTMPLGGPVSVSDLMGQFFAPMTLQTGLVNIYNMNSTNRQAEQKITADVAGYGQQLGWILEAVDLLIHKLEHTTPLQKLTDEEEDKLDRVKTLKHRIDDLKKSLPKP